MSETLAPSHLRPTDALAETGFAGKSIGRLMINAAFLQEIKEDNRQLKTLWDRLVPMLAYPETAQNHWGELVAGLAELRDQLAIHFSLEEAYGYFDDAVDAAPQLSVQAEGLKAEHPKLFAQVRDLADRILETNVEQIEHVGRFLRHFDRFRRNFEQHEEAELKLILQSFDDDLGVGD